MHDDGFYRLQTVRYESVHLTQPVKNVPNQVTATTTSPIQSAIANHNTATTTCTTQSTIQHVQETLKGSLNIFNVLNTSTRPNTFIICFSDSAHIILNPPHIKIFIAFLIIWMENVQPYHF